ncbi:MAG TPA: hypothetical protein VFJ82_00830 [Longimicrobium sp.]|nr:hypothetical protein [Longimicrobium sp.]
MLLLQAALAVALAADTGGVPAATSLPAAVPAPSWLAAADTTPQPRAIDYSDAYGNRLAVHKVASYATRGR